MSRVDTLGDLLKDFEMKDAGQTVMRGVPIIARLDGRAFHTFTKGLKRPYDQRLSDAMVSTAKFLLEETNAKLAYTQSDEITLYWDNALTKENNMLFSGRFQKLTSVLASLASVHFYKQIITNIPDKASATPIFDCRVFQVPNNHLVADCFKWRELDATKNAISMAAHAYFPHRQLNGMSGSEKQELLFAVKGINFDQYPVFFKRGTYVRKAMKFMEIDEVTRMRIPEKNRPEKGTRFYRNVVQEMNWPKCTCIENWVEVICYDALPTLRASND